MAAPMAIASMAGTAAGGLVQGIGAKYQADAQAAASTYKAGVALLNKQINLQNASWASQSGDVAAVESGLKSKQQIGQTKVEQAASGLDVNTGTGKAVRETQSTVSQYDQNVIRFDASKTAYGYESKATLDDAQSKLDLMAADTQRTAGTIAEIGSFINAGSSVASKWMQASQIGVFS